MEPLTLTLHKAKDTKNKVVYGTKDGSVIQSVYIDKDALGDAPPATIQVVISEQQAWSQPLEVQTLFRDGDEDESATARDVEQGGELD